MLYRKLKSTFLILLTFLGTALVLTGFVTNTPPLVPDAYAAPPSNYGILGLWNEGSKTNALVGTAIAQGTQVTFDVNVTDAGTLKGFDINFTFTSSQIAYAGSAFGTVSNTALVSCPASAGCLLDGLSVLRNTNVTGTGGNSYRLSLVDQDSAHPTISGTGILFRVRFRTVLATSVSGIHITSSSTLQNPASVPYTPIDGYIDSNAAATANYNIAVSVATTTLVRPVSRFQTNSTSPALTVTLSASGTFPSSVVLKAWSLPLIGSSAVFTPSSLTAAGSSSLTVTIHGGPQGGSTTTPPGTYILALEGNSTVSGNILIKVAWLKLIVKAPAAPVYNISASRTSFNQEAGNWTTVTISSSLLSGANDSLSVSSDCGTVLSGGTCTFSPPAGVYPCALSGCTYPTAAFTTLMNVSSLTSTTLGVKYIHVLITTTGTYSQSAVTMPSETVIAGSLQVDFPLVSDAKLKYVDLNANNHWDVGEPVVYDGDNSGTFNAATQTLKTDTKIKFVDGNANGHWDLGESVVYDNNNDNKFNTGKFNNDTLFYGTRPLNNTALAVDTHLKFFGPGVAWASLNSVVYDANANNLFDTGDTNLYGNTLDIIVSGSPANLAALKTDPLIRFYDPTRLGYWLNSSTAYDGNNNSLYDVGLTITVTLNKTHDGQVSTVVEGNRGFAYNGVSLTGAAQLRVNVTVTNGGTVSDTYTVNATARTVLKNDGKIKFRDANGNGIWDPGEMLFYDNDNSGTYSAGDTVIGSGTPPALGTLISLDFNLVFVDSNYKGVWACSTLSGVNCTAGDAVVYNPDGDGLYDTADVVAFGTTPSPGILVAQTTVTLAPAAQQVVSLAWDPGSLPRGYYTIFGAAAPVVGEFVISNNVGSYPINFLQKFKGDVSGDCKVDIIDLSTVGAAFGSSIGGAAYKANADLNNDNTINIIDLVLVAGSFGQSC